MKLEFSRHSSRPALAGLVFAATLGLSACGSSGSPDSETGRLSLNVSDGPIHDAEKVCITFDAIEFKSAGDDPAVRVELDPAEKVNLLDFQGMNAAPILIDEELAAGDYAWMRLYIDAELGSNGGAGDTGGVMCDGEGSYVSMDDGSVYNLYVPSSAQTGLKLVSGFTVPPNGSANFTIEFDLMKSITQPPGLSPDLVMRPALRLVNNVDAGALIGEVDSALAAASGCDPAVYLFDDGVAPNAITNGEDDPNDPVATALVEARDNAGVTEYHYSMGFLLPGDYEAAFTCDGETFYPVDGIGVTIEAGETTRQDFILQTS